MQQAMGRSLIAEGHVISINSDTKSYGTVEMFLIFRHVNETSNSHCSCQFDACWMPALTSGIPIS